MNGTKHGLLAGFLVCQMLVPIAAEAKGVGKTTHLGVGVADIVNLVSFCAPQNNTSGHLFYYDRDISRPFQIPAGVSFVVTDIIVQPCFGAPDTRVLTVMAGPSGYRTFIASYSGGEYRHFALTGGIAYRSGQEPQLRNTTSSTTSVQFQLLGYFVKGDALDTN